MFSKYFDLIIQKSDKNKKGNKKIIYLFCEIKRTKKKFRDNHLDVCLRFYVFQKRNILIYINKNFCKKWII